MRTQGASMFWAGCRGQARPLRHVASVQPTVSVVLLPPHIAARRSGHSAAVCITFAALSHLSLLAATAAAVAASAAAAAGGRGGAAAAPH
jgi:hypothetical protein